MTLRSSGGSDRKPKGGLLGLAMNLGLDADSGSGCEVADGGGRFTSLAIMLLTAQRTTTKGIK